jgi:hypothetical protein
MKRLIILLGIGFLTLTLVSCGGKKKPPPPPVIVEAPNYEPIAEGWKVQSFTLLGIAIIAAIVVIGKRSND